MIKSPQVSESSQIKSPQISESSQIKSPPLLPRPRNQKKRKLDGGVPQKNLVRCYLLPLKVRNSSSSPLTLNYANIAGNIVGKPAVAFISGKTWRFLVVLENGKRIYKNRVPQQVKQTLKQ